MSGTAVRPILALATGFAVLGGVGSVLMTRQPEFYQRWALDNAEWGWALFALGLGGVLAYPVNRWLLARWGSRLLLLRFGLAGGFVLCALPWLPGLGGLLSGLFLQGVIYNGVSVAINQQASHWELRRGTRMMGRLHATFFFGSVASALFSSLLATLHFDLALHLALVGVVGALSHRAVARALAIDDAAFPPVAAPVAPEGWRGLGLLFCWCTVLESGVMGWASVYLNQTLGASDNISGAGFAVFAAAMALGRLASDTFALRYGAFAVVRAGGIACGFALGLASLVSSLPLALVAFAVTGLGLAAAAPAIFSAAGRMGGAALALTASLGAVGGLLGPLVLGRIANWLTIDWILAMLGAIGFLIAHQARALAEFDRRWH